MGKLTPRLWRIFDLYFGKIGFLPNATYPDWNERDEVYVEIFEQAENFKKNRK